MLHQHRIDHSFILYVLGLVFLFSISFSAFAVYMCAENLTPRASSFLIHQKQVHLRSGGRAACLLSHFSSQSQNRPRHVRPSHATGNARYTKLCCDTCQCLTNVFFFRFCFFLVFFFVWIKAALKRELRSKT